ncbi:hypothetical protein GALL_198280 [mine drainage metagenome]|uniref:Uncharacterized protein n=1 Tax=mine drainage metagenome TaxID=410659 RepID=A0A1J5RRH9_9ZZZZ
MRGQRAGQPLGAHIGDAVALGVGAAHTRAVGQVDAETVGRAQAGALADQHHHLAGTQQRADFVAQRHARLLGHHHGADAPAGQALAGFDEQGHGVLLRGARRKAVGDDEHHVAGIGMQRGQAFAAGGVGPAAEVGAAQVLRAVGGGAVRAQRGAESGVAQRGQQGDGVEPGVHGVARLGMGQAKVEHGAGGQTVAGTAEGDTRQRETAQILPGVGRREAGGRLRGCGVRGRHVGGFRGLGRGHGGLTIARRRPAAAGAGRGPAGGPGRRRCPCGSARPRTPGRDACRARGAGRGRRGRMCSGSPA